MATLNETTLPAASAAFADAAERGSRLRVPSWSSLAPLADALVLTFAVFVERIGNSAAGAGPLPTMWFVLFPPVTLALLAVGRLYRPRLRVQLLDDLRTVAGATAIAAMTTVSASVLVGGHANVAAEGVRLWLFSTVYLAASRGGVISAAVAARRDGHGGAPTLIIGAGSVGRLLAKRLANHPEIGLRPIGFLDKEPREFDSEDRDSPRLPVLGASWDLAEVIDRYKVERVIFTFSTAPHDVLLRMIDECTARGVHVTLVPRLFEKMPRQLTIDHIGGISLLSIGPTNPRGRAFVVKYAFDRIAAAIALVLLAPVFLIVAGEVWRSLGRPILFRQRRVGRDGEPFEMLKFRTMHGDPDAECADIELPPDTAPGGVEGEDRRSSAGAFLRRTSLDELPQLVNVLRGEMTLVGPRPERPEFVSRFEHDIYRYGDRHRVKAGITGWAQIHGLRGNTSLAERAEWDNFYIENASLSLDVRILLHTLVAVVRPRNAV